MFQLEEDVPRRSRAQSRTNMLVSPRSSTNSRSRSRSSGSNSRGPQHSPSYTNANQISPPRTNSLLPAAPQATGREGKAPRATSREGKAPQATGREGKAPQATGREGKAGQLNEVAATGKHTEAEHSAAQLPTDLPTIVHRNAAEMAALRSTIQELHAEGAAAHDREHKVTHENKLLREAQLEQQQLLNEIKEREKGHQKVFKWNQVMETEQQQRVQEMEEREKEHQQVLKEMEERELEQQQRVHEMEERELELSQAHFEQLTELKRQMIGIKEGHTARALNDRAEIERVHCEELAVAELEFRILTEVCDGSQLPLW